MKQPNFFTVCRSDWSQCPLQVSNRRSGRPCLGSSTDAGTQVQSLSVLQYG
jgi:hypothetical protein